MLKFCIISEKNNTKYCRIQKQDNKVLIATGEMYFSQDFKYKNYTKNGRGKGERACPCKREIIK